MKRRVRADSSKATKDSHRRLASHIWKCDFCGVEFPSECRSRMRALGRHMFTCSKRPQSAGGGEDLCVDEFVEGEGEEFFDGGEEGEIEGGVELDGEIYSDCDDGPNSFDDSDEEEEVEENYFNFKPIPLRSYAEELDSEQSLKFDGPKPKPSKSNCLHVEMPTSAMVPVSRVLSRSKGFWYCEGRFDNRNVWASDFFLKDAVAAMKLSKRAPAHLPIPDTSLLEYQMEMVEAYFTPGKKEAARGDQPLKINKKKGVAKDWRDPCLLYNFACKHQLMSRTAGADLLELIESISENHCISIPLHANWINLVEAMEKQISARHPLIRWSWQLPKLLFGCEDAKGRPLRPIKSVTYDIMKTSAMKLLLVNPDEYAFGPPPLQDPRVISGFHTSDVFIKICQTLRNLKGDGAVPCCIFGSWDASTNRSRQISMTPLTFGFLQAFGDSDVVHLAGYFPSAMSHTDNDLLRLLRKIWNCTAVGLRDQVLADTKRKYILDFPHSVLSVLLTYEEKGLMLQVGRGAKAVRRHMFPFVCGFMMDSKEADMINGTSHKRTHRNSRITVEDDTWTMPETAMGQFIVRDSRVMEELTRVAELVTIQKISYCGDLAAAKTAQEKSAAKASAAEEEQWKRIDRAMEFYGLTPGINQNYKLVAFLEENNICNFSTLFQPDKLHTVGMGALECILSWAILLILAFDYVLGTDGMGIVDERVRNFPIHQSFNPTRPVKFPDGISCFLKAEATKGPKRKQNSGQVSCKWR